MSRGEMYPSPQRLVPLYYGAICNGLKESHIKAQLMLCIQIGSCKIYVNITTPYISSAKNINVLGVLSLQDKIT